MVGALTIGLNPLLRLLDSNQYILHLIKIIVVQQRLSLHRLQVLHLLVGLHLLHLPREAVDLRRLPAVDTLCFLLNYNITSQLCLSWDLVHRLKLVWNVVCLVLVDDLSPLRLGRAALRRSKTLFFVCLSGASKAVYFSK